MTGSIPQKSKKTMLKFGSMNTVILKVALGSALSAFGITYTQGISVAQIQLPDVVPGEIVNSVKGTTLKNCLFWWKVFTFFGSNTSFGTSAT